VGRHHSRSHHSGSLGQCTLEQCPLIQLWRPPVYSTFGPGVSQQRTRLGKRSCLLALRSIATDASHQSRPKTSTGHLASGQAQSRTQRRLNYRVNLNLQWIGSCANASHANRHRSASEPLGWSSAVGTKTKADPKRRATVIPIFCRYQPMVRLDDGARDGQAHAFRLRCCRRRL
jgi:hypothetical protein